MAEFLDVLDSKGKKTGESVSYEDAHAKGLMHRTAHVWLANSKGQLLLQKRSRDKVAYPGFWDISAAGHISSGESSIEGAKREVEEEIGLALPDEAFRLLFTIKQPRLVHRADFIDDEYNDVYLVRSDAGIADLRASRDEVEGLRWIDVAELKKWMCGEGEKLVPHEEEYTRLIGMISADRDE